MGLDHTAIAAPLRGLGNLYTEQCEYEQAKRLYERALRIWEQTFGSDYRQLAYHLNGLGNIYSEQGIHERAELLYRRALSLRQKYLGRHHPDVAETLHDLARHKQMQQRTTEALSLYQQALEIREQSLGLHHRQTLKTRKLLLELFEQVGYAQEAIVQNGQVPELKNALLCACGCGHEIDMSKSRGEPRRFFSNACKQRFYRHASRQKRNAISEQ